MKRINSGKSFLALLTIVVVLLSSFAAGAQRSNFSGEWKLDESKSELGEMGMWAARSIKAEQKEDAITIARTTPGFNGGDPVTTTLTVTYDGKVAESAGFGGSKRKSTAKWSDDGKTLTISSTTNFERDGNSFELKATENWTLLASGHLSIATNSTSPRGESSTKAVYGK